MIKCNTCRSQGLSLQFKSSTIGPEDYIEGNHSSPVWIIGLNPKGSIGIEEYRTVKELQNFSPEQHSYFKKFRKVSAILYENWNSKLSKVAHTDIVKCFAPQFPPIIDDVPLDVTQIIKNCSGYLLKQINTYKPQIIVCNGSQVCKEMIKHFPPKSGEPPLHTSYKAESNEHKFWIILSGFIGRIDDRNKRRLGQEIERIAKEEKILF